MTPFDAFQHGYSDASRGSVFSAIFLTDSETYLAYMSGFNAAIQHARKNNRKKPAVKFPRGVSRVKTVVERVAVVKLKKD